jgi:Domain of unknown function (DUF1844)
VTTLAQLAQAKLQESSRDLQQAQLAIDSIQALLPKLEGHIPAELSRDLGQMVTSLQLEYADAVAG